MHSPALLLDLAQLLNVGIAPLEASRRIANGHPNEKATLALLQKNLQRGQALATALHSAGFATKFEKEILSVAEQAGKLDEALRLVARNLETRQARASSLRMRLWLPNTIVFIALLIGIVRAETAGVALSSALIAAVATALIVGVFTQTLLAAAKADSARWLALGWRLGAHRNRLYRRYFEQRLFTLLSWQIDAGVDFALGAKHLTPLVEARGYRQAINHYRLSIVQGASFSDALAQAELVLPGELAQTIRVGEQAGRLGAALRQYLERRGQALEDVTDSIYRCLPRIYYALVVVAGASTLL